MDFNKEEMLRRIQESAAQNPDTLDRMNRMKGMLDGAQSIAHIIAAYRVGCIPPKATAQQIHDIEQAQFAACQMLMKMMLDKARESEGAAQLWVDVIMAEIDQYASQRIALMMARPEGQH